MLHNVKHMCKSFQPMWICLKKHLDHTFWLHPVHSNYLKVQFQKHGWVMLNATETNESNESNGTNESNKEN